jgi:ergothioneine biosynthesis protein EgtB
MRARATLDGMMALDPLARFERVRQRSMLLVAPLSDEDCGAQSMPDASPLKWHLAHTTWFFETFVLEALEMQFIPFHRAFRMLFNSYYNGIGARHPRARRGLLTRPCMADVCAYRQDIDQRMTLLLRSDLGDTERAQLADLLELGLQHEQQHQELMLTDVKHLLAHNPLLPAYLDAPLGLASPLALAAPQQAWLAFDGGLTSIGFEPGVSSDSEGSGFCFDNELPRHLAYIAPFELAARLVTNREFLDFIESGGYRNADLWLSEGWDWVCREQIAAPLYWQCDDDGQWHEFTLHGLQPLALARPACHLSLFEADAYAHWVAARLPTEAEWECAQSAMDARSGAGAASGLTMAEQDPVRHLHPNGATHDGLAQMFGCCWQWTSSSYAPYPGYRAARGALGEYNGKFMLNQYVLRGSSCATPPGHARASYRNFFAADARWQFTGIRLAR